jgi:hypothetical protein
LDNLVDYLAVEIPFQAIVIIDEETEELHSVVKQFSFPVEIIELVAEPARDTGPISLGKWERDVAP